MTNLTIPLYATLSGIATVGALVLRMMYQLGSVLERFRNHIDDNRSQFTEVFDRITYLERRRRLDDYANAAHVAALASYRSDPRRSAGDSSASNQLAYG